MRLIDEKVTMFSMNDGEEIVEITSHWYWHFYNCMPPIGYDPCFLVGEPHDHDEEGYPRFTLVFRYNGRCYAAQPLRAKANRHAVMNELIEKYLK